MPPLTATNTPAVEPRKSTHQGASSTTPPRLVLPYVVGLPPVGRAGNWATLRAAALRSGVRDCAHAFCAVGLPPGSVATALTVNRWALRSTLGSAAALKLSTTKLSEWRAAREAREARRLIEVDRQRVCVRPSSTLCLSQYVVSQG